LLSTPRKEVIKLKKAARIPADYEENRNKYLYSISTPDPGVKIITQGINQDYRG
jgi:hypothetical protein